MIKNRKDMKLPTKIEIDLNGPNGNAFCLMGIAKRLCTQLGIDSKAIIAEMMSNDYENLITVLDREFGDSIILYR